MDNLPLSVEEVSVNHQQVCLFVRYNSGITNRVFTDQSNTMGGEGGTEGVGWITFIDLLKRSL